MCPDAAFTVYATAVGPHVLAVVTGKIDQQSAPHLDRALRDCLAQHPASIDLDLAAVTFCDGAGLHVLLDTWVRAGGTDLRLADPSPPVLRLLVLSGAAALLGLNVPISVTEAEEDRFDARVHLLTAFIRDRLDEEDRDAELFHEFACAHRPAKFFRTPGGVVCVCGCRCHTHVELHAVAEISRRFTDDYERRALGEDTTTRRGPLDPVLALNALKEIAFTYAPHPRWREGWRP